MRDVLRAVGRERAVICGILIAVLQAVSAGTITRETAVPVIAGIVLRFLVSPYPPEGEAPVVPDRYVPVHVGDLAELSDAEQVVLAENTDSGPQSDAEAAMTASLPQEPDSAVD